ncbi:head completion/stabilization protein [Aliivibrio fischeri]|uniref:head completion/stabilization protein n=1 Tax=Aliivibrio fischeri TaxID=668 RepID=UPI00084C21C6|nr:head completion/stabilization protein [Aliivibrio fischeri]OED52907.1 hypothetical protein BEI47_18720 [Aliivibrio fischeri]
MEFMGDKDKVYDSILPATEYYPELALSEFQSLFHFLSNETEESLLQQVRVARIMTHRELLAAMSPFESLDELSQAQFGDIDTGTTLYKQAVFSLAADFIISNQLSTDTTKDAAERQEALTQKAEHCSVQYRRAIDLLINAHETYRIEVI